MYAGVLVAVRYTQIRRAPTITVFFSEATPWNVAAALDEVAERFQLTSSDAVEWRFPASENWRVIARLHDTNMDCGAASERELIRAEVGAAPSAAVNLVLYRRTISQACDAARILVAHLLERFHGIVDDRCSEDPIWSIEEIRRTKRGTEFMDCYRDQQQRAG